MSCVSKRRSESSGSRCSIDGDSRHDVERDECKRKSRNLSEKKRRDQFNMLINELSSMVSSSPRKMDKSTVLKATIGFLKVQNVSTQSQKQDNSENWKPSFLSNEEFTYLMLEANDGFIMVISSSGRIIYVSESVTSLLGHLPSDIVSKPVYDLILPEEQNLVYNMLNPPNNKQECISSVIVNMKLGGFELKPTVIKYQLVKIKGYTKHTTSNDCGSDEFDMTGDDNDDASIRTNGVFICTSSLVDAELLREISVVVDSSNTEFCSRHSLEWKFLFLDDRAVPIIGYLPFEVLGTSGYDYYHMDDLEKVANCHEALMQKGEGTSCFYRFLTKGQQWIWLQTRYYITYHQWNSKPEFIVGVNRVVSNSEVLKELRVNEAGRIFFGHSGVLSSNSSKTDFNSKTIKKCSSTMGNNIQKSPIGLSPFLPPGKSATKFEHSSTSVVPGNAQETCIRNQMALHDVKNQFKDTTTFLNPNTSTTGYTILSQPYTTSAFTPLISSNNANLSNPLIEITSHEPVPSYSLSNEVLSGQTSGSQHSNTQSNTVQQSPIQEQLLMKHAELQLHISQQQEELRKISEQLLMSQVGANTESVPESTPNTSILHSQLHSRSEDRSSQHQVRYIQ